MNEDLAKGMSKLYSYANYAFKLFFTNHDHVTLGAGKKNHKFSRFV